MSKYKKKASHRNPLHYLFEKIFLLRRDFYIETQLPYNVCTQIIRDLPSDETGFHLLWDRPNNTIEVTDMNDRYDFEVVRRRLNGAHRIPSARVRGNISRIGTQNTVIDFSSKMSDALIFAVLGLLFAWFARWFIDLGWDIVLLILILPSLYIWWRCYIDRNKLINLITEAIQSSEKQKRISRLQHDDTQDETDYEAAEVKHKADSR